MGKTTQVVTLYKYYKVDSNLKDVIKKEHIYFSSLNQLNDVYELKNCSIGNNNNQIDIKVVCLTGSGKNRIMWANYAENSTGVMITFEIKKEFVHPICYTRFLVGTKDLNEILANSLKKPKKNLITNYIGLSEEEKIGYVKDYAFMYENEYRIVLNSNDIEKFNDNIEEIKGKHFFKAKIKRIYLGYKFDEKKSKKIIRMCKKKNIEIKKIELSSNKYEIKTIDFKG